MATLTPNYNLSKPDATDNFSAFRQSYNDNMDIIDANLGGGGGGGSAHTIVNESGTALADEPNLQFTDGLTATDDSVNTKTKVGVDTTFTESATRTNIASGDSLATILGKIKKWFSDLPSMFVSKSGDTMTGDLTIHNQSSNFLTLGGAYTGDDGYFKMYGGNGASLIQPPSMGFTRPRDHYLPDKSGTIALTSDIPDISLYKNVLNPFQYKGIMGMNDLTSYDFNDYITGTYRNAGTSNFTNSPLSLADNGWLICFTYSRYSYQFWISTYRGTPKYRRNEEGTWTAWQTWNF